MAKKYYPGEFGAVLQDIRISEGETQRDMSERIGAPLQTIRGWEQSYCLPTPKYWKRIKDLYSENYMFNTLEVAYVSGKRLSRQSRV